MQLYITALQEGFLYGIMALGIFISLRILNIPDLTTEGSFGFGLSIAAVLAAKGFVITSILLAVIAGAAAGFTTGFLQTKLSIHPVLAGIITMSGLYSINLLCLGAANMSLNDNTLFRVMKEAFFPNSSGMDSKIFYAVISGFICLLIMVILIWFFRTHFGMCIRATGDNEQMVRSSSINVNITKTAGLCIANALVALSGACIAHAQNYADIHSSNGTLVVGLASVIIGEALLGKRSIVIGILSAVTGSIAYRFIVAFVLSYNICGANMMKLMCALVVAVTLSIPAVKNQMAVLKLKKEAKKHADH